RRSRTGIPLRLLCRSWLSWSTRSTTRCSSMPAGPSRTSPTARMTRFRPSSRPTSRVGWSNCSCIRPPPCRLPHSARSATLSLATTSRPNSSSTVGLSAPCSPCSARPRMASGRRRVGRSLTSRLATAPRSRRSSMPTSSTRSSTCSATATSRRAKK
ncbi:hypothetical protein LTR53_019307, partial [Teratosphaeriaceae sp. CCFEE 6253]